MIVQNLRVNEAEITFILLIKFRVTIRLEPASQRVEILTLHFTDRAIATSIKTSIPVSICCVELITSSFLHMPYIVWGNP